MTKDIFLLIKQIKIAILSKSIRRKQNKNLRIRAEKILKEVLKLRIKESKKSKGLIIGIVLKLIKFIQIQLQFR